MGKEFFSRTEQLIASSGIELRASSFWVATPVVPPTKLYRRLSNQNDTFISIYATLGGLKLSRWFLHLTCFTFSET